MIRVAPEGVFIKTEDYVSFQTFKSDRMQFIMY